MGDEESKGVEREPTDAELAAMPEEESSEPMDPDTNDASRFPAEGSDLGE